MVRSGRSVFHGRISHILRHGDILLKDYEMFLVKERKVEANKCADRTKTRPSSDQVSVGQSCMGVVSFVLNNEVISLSTTR